MTKTHEDGEDSRTIGPIDYKTNNEDDDDTSLEEEQPPRRFRTAFIYFSAARHREIRERLSVERNATQVRKGIHLILSEYGL